MSATNTTLTPDATANSGCAATLVRLYLTHLAANWKVSGKGLLLAGFHFVHGVIPCRWTEHEFWNLNLTKQ